MDAIHESLDDVKHTKEELEQCFKIFDANDKEKVDINQLLAIKQNNETLKEMQHSKWATSNNLFDYNAFINDFYALLEEYKSYKSRFQETTQELSSEQKSANLQVLSSIKGSFFYNGDNVISHQYSMVMNRASKVKISLQVNKPMDMDIFVFHIRQDKSDINYKFICKSEVSIGTQKEVVWEGTLDKGVYVLIPSTTGCLFRKRQNQPTSDIHLTIMENGEIQLSHEYHQAIIEIFHQLDLDESGSLSKAEFNLYNWRTSGMEMKDEDWENLSKKLGIQDDEMSLAQFIQLHLLEAKNGESVELWMALWTMGYNHTLKPDESFNFKLEISSLINPMVKVFGLRSGGMLLEKATISWIMEGAEKLYAGSQQQIVLYLKSCAKCTSVVAQNSSQADQKVELDFSASKNAIINHPHSKFSIHLPKTSVLFIAHILTDGKGTFVPKVAIKMK